MKDLTKFLAFLFLCSSCGIPDGRYIDSILRPYVVEFEEYMSISVKSDIEFDHLDGALGTCTKRLGRNLVLINESVKIYINEEYIMSIIYHELGHCEIKLEHENDFIEIREGIYVPSTFMTENMYPPSVYHELGFDFYKEELKHRAHH